MTITNQALVDKNNIVTNIITHDSEGGYIPPNGVTLITISGTTPNIGATWDGTNFTNPADTTPPSKLAKAALLKSDLTVTRCYAAGIQFPIEWVNYRAALKLIINNNTGPLPERPPYPEGS